MELTPKRQLTYTFNAYRDGLNYCLEVRTPFAKHLRIFPTYNGYKEYVEMYTRHLEWNNQKIKWDNEL